MTLSKSKKDGGHSVGSRVPTVKVEECRERHAAIDKREDRFDLAMYGKDGRGGMVADIADIKTKLGMATSILRTVVIPIAVPVILAVVGFFIGARSH